MGGGTGSGTIWSDWFEYKPTTNTWEKRANGSNGYFQFSMGTMGYIFTSGSTYFSMYDATTDKWTDQTDFYFPGLSVGGATKWPAMVNGRAYFGLGKASSNLTNEWWSFAPGQ